MKKHAGSFGDTVVFKSGWKTSPAPQNCPFHDHAHIEIVFHPCGRGVTKTSQGMELDFYPGTAIIYPPNLMHSQQMVEQGDDLVVQLVCNPLPSWFQTAVAAHEISDRYILQSLDELVKPPAARDSCQQREYDFRAGALLLHLIQRANQSYQARQANIIDGYAEVAFNLIRQKYQLIGTVADIADELDISYDHLRHLFLKQYGMSMQQWLVRTRVERAADLLKHSTLPLKRIAWMCGFNSDRYLCTVFRQQRKMSPNEFRKKSFSKPEL